MAEHGHYKQPGGVQQGRGAGWPLGADAEVKDNGRAGRPPRSQLGAGGAAAEDRQELRRLLGFRGGTLGQAGLAVCWLRFPYLSRRTAHAIHISTGNLSVHLECGARSTGPSQEWCDQHR